MFATFRMIPIDLLILDAMVAMWTSQLRDSSIETPRNLAYGVRSIGMPFIETLRGMLRALL